MNLLYHFTTKRTLRKILKDNCLRVSNSYNVVSFTRDKNLIYRSTYLKTRKANAIIVIDRNKLKCDYKVQPHNYFTHKLDNPKMYKHESEEVVFKNIKNLSKYIVEIIKSDGVSFI